MYKLAVQEARTRYMRMLMIRKPHKAENGLNRLLDRLGKMKDASELENSNDAKASFHSDTARLCKMEGQVCEELGSLKEIAAINSGNLDVKPSLALYERAHCNLYAVVHAACLNVKQGVETGLTMDQVRQSLEFEFKLKLKFTDFVLMC